MGWSRVQDADLAAVPDDDRQQHGCRRLLGDLGVRQRRTLDDLIVLLVDARDRTYPPSLLPTWADWLPRDEEEHADARVWSACEHLALASPQVAAAVVEVWRRQRTSLARLTEHPEDSKEAAALHALISGLTVRLLLDPDFDHSAALTVLTAGIEALAGCTQRCLHDET